MPFQFIFCILRILTVLKVSYQLRTVCEKVLITRLTAKSIVLCALLQIHNQIKKTALPLRPSVYFIGIKALSISQSSTGYS
jgi:hypothetical protein